MTDLFVRMFVTMTGYNRAGAEALKVREIKRRHQQMPKYRGPARSQTALIHGRKQLRSVRVPR